MGSTWCSIIGYSSRPSWLKPWSGIARKWMRRKGWHGVYYFNLVFCSSHNLAGADFCQILHFCKSTIFSVQNGYRLVQFTSFPKWLTNPYSLSNYFMIMIDENFFSRLILKISISKFFEISKKRNCMYSDYVGSELNATKSDGTIFLYLYIPYIDVF